MAHGIIFIALLLSTLALSMQEDNQNADNKDEDHYYKESESISNSEEIQQREESLSVPVNKLEIKHVQLHKILEIERDREERTTEKQIAKYEVTELVIDVPELSTRRVPIIANFTLTRPLNFAGVPKNKTNDVGINTKDEGDEIINSIWAPDNSRVKNNNKNTNVEDSNNNYNEKRGEKDYFSNENKDSFEEEFDKEFGSNEDESDSLEDKETPNLSKGFKHHFHNFKKNVVDEFKSVVNKHKDGIHSSLSKIVNGPILFFSKLHKKSSELAEKLHKAVSGHTFNDDDDDIDYHDVDHDFGND